jgi:hypothetical protein
MYGVTSDSVQYCTLMQNSLCIGICSCLWCAGLCCSVELGGVQFCNYSMNSIEHLTIVSFLLDVGDSGCI